MSNEPELLAYAANLEVKCSEAKDSEVWFSVFKKFFDDLTSNLKKPGVVIGHNKGFLELDNRAYAYLSNTGNNLGTDINSQGEGYASSGKLGFNVLLYGVKKEAVKHVLSQEIIKLKKDLSCECLLEETDE